MTDLVTLVDQGRLKDGLFAGYELTSQSCAETEKLIISELRKAFPESEFLSEEDNAESGVKEVGS